MQDLLENKAQESAEDLIEQIEERSRTIEATAFRRPDQSRWRVVLLALAVVSSAAFLAWDMRRQTESPVPFDQEELRAGLEFALFVTASGIEAYRERTGQLPENLEQAGLDHPLVQYLNTAAGYRLVGTSGGNRIEFAEGGDLEGLGASYWALREQAAS